MTNSVFDIKQRKDLRLINNILEGQDHEQLKKEILTIWGERNELFECFIDTKRIADKREDLLQRSLNRERAVFEINQAMTEARCILMERLKRLQSFTFSVTELMVQTTLFDKTALTTLQNLVRKTKGNQEVNLGLRQEKREREQREREEDQDLQS